MDVMVFPRGTKRGLAWLAVAALAATILIAFQQQQRTAVKLADAAGGHISDFDRWMLMTPRLLHDGAGYVNDDLPTPPLSLMVFAPLSSLSRPNAAFVWVLLKLPLAALVFYLAAAVVARAGVPLTPEAIALIVAGWWLAVIVDMQEGQTNFLALAPLMGALALAQRDSLPADAAAGVLLALGIAMKVTPIIFVAYFLWKRRFVLAGAAMVSVAIWSLCVPALVFGWDQNLRWFEQWARIMIVPFVSEGRVVYSTTQSVPSFVLRLLTVAPAFDSHHGGVTASHYMNAVALSDQAARDVARFLMAAAGIAGLWWARRPLPTFRSQRYVFEIAGVAAFMLWFSERTWVHHYVSFILTLAAAGMILSDPAHPAIERRLVRGALIVFAAVTVFASELGRIFGPDGIDWAKAVGVYLWPSVIVTVAVLRAAAGRSAALESGAVA